MQQQLDLFDAASAKQLRRRDDPEESREAAREIAPELSGVQQRLYDFAKGWVERFTARELAEALHRCDQANDVETYRKRCRELARKGWFEEAGKQQCAITGKNAMSFRIPTEKRDA